MFSREIQLDTQGGPVTLAPRRLRVPGAVKYSGLSRSKLYELLSDGKIRSICVRSQKGHCAEFVSLTESRSTRSWKATRPCEVPLASDPFRAQQTRGTSLRRNKMTSDRRGNSSFRALSSRVAGKRRPKAAFEIRKADRERDKKVDRVL